MTGIIEHLTAELGLPEDIARDLADLTQELGFLRYSEPREFVKALTRFRWECERLGLDPRPLERRAMGRG
jgi:hypothetical protein